MTNDVQLYLVGGAVRDFFRGQESKDWDFACEAESFDHMRQWLIENNFTIFAETPKYFTLRARAPKDQFKFGTMNLAGSTFDFTLCRLERDYTDGRRPDIVEVGTIYDDLSRRDFTMNAIALDKQGRTIDPFDGLGDIFTRSIRCVGGVERLKEDALRMLRAMRFQIQLGMPMDIEITSFLATEEAASLLSNVSTDRIRDELTKMFKADSYESIHLLSSFTEISWAIFGKDRAWLKPTTESK